MSTCATDIPANIAEITGPLFLGIILAYCLLGALLVQSYVYYLSFPRDTRVLKGLVVFTVVAEVLQSVITMMDTFQYFATGWGNMELLDDIRTMWFAIPFLGSIISAVTQLFFAWRVWTLSKSYWIPGVIALLAATQNVAGIWTGIHAHILGHWSLLQAHTNITTTIWLAGTALCDVVITTSMVYYITRPRSGFALRNVLLAKLLRLTVETGFVCAVFAIIDLVFFLVYKTNNYHLAPSIPLSKMYSNSLLMVLNARMRITDGRLEQAAAKAAAARPATTTDTDSCHWVSTSPRFHDRDTHLSIYTYTAPSIHGMTADEYISNPQTDDSTNETSKITTNRTNRATE